MKIAEYIWLGGNNEFRSKIKTIVDFNDIKKWDYDGSSTNQANGESSEIVLVPVAVHPNPFYRNNINYLVLCATYRLDGTPLENNYRDWAKNLFDKDLDSEPWYGLEQEYFILDPKTMLPIGYNENAKQGQYYCSIGCLNAYGREIAEEHLEACLYSNIYISGINSEVAVGQWEFQIGPCTGIEAGDHLLIARYILERIAEKHNYIISYEPKPLKGWNGSGCHTNYSTEKMRNENGLDTIFEAINKLKLKHSEHMEIYGENNKERLTGIHETSSYNDFSFGVANRGSSIRINHNTINDKKGYFEDRRPAANMNPYLVTAKIFETTVLL